MKSLTSLRTLGRSDLEAIISEASTLRDDLDSGAPIAAALRGVCVANLFFEPSTRTRLSFDLAAQRLGAHVITFDPSTASTLKGETLRDTVLTVAAIGADILVVRHAEDGVPQCVADWTGVPVVNAGDGASEHPTQTLLDALTIQRHFGRIDGVTVGIVGDIAHSRVAGSLQVALPALGADLVLVGPEEWLPGESPLRTTGDLDDILPDLDVVYLLRVQKERGGLVSDEYVQRFGLHSPRLSRLRPDAVVMHPGPINRGVEIADEVAESPRSLIGEQVRNGVPTRMAVLRAMAGARS